MRELHRARNFDHQFRRLPHSHRLACQGCIQLPTFDELHAEVTRTVALPDFVDRSNARMMQARRRLRFQPKPSDVRFCRPMTEADQLQCYNPVEAFLPRAKHNPLTTAPNFFEQFIIAKVHHQWRGDAAWQIFRPAIMFKAALY